MSFLSPGWLLLLLAVAGVGAAYVVQLRRKSAYTVRFTNLDLLDTVAPTRPRWRRHLTAGLFLLALVAMVVALARPARDVDVPVERATVVLAIDTSLSMEAADVAPSRIEAAQAAADELIDGLPPEVNLGLVAFNGVAQITVAPTVDRQAVRDAVDELTLGEATAIGEAIFAGLDAIDLAPDGDDEDPAPGAIVVMSDGETTVGRADSLATEAAASAEVPVSTIAFGTPDGEITIAGEPEPIPVQVDEASLEAIAADTDGAFFRAGTESDLAEAFGDLGSALGTETRQEEITSWFLGLGVALLLATAVASLLWFSRLP